MGEQQKNVGSVPTTGTHAYTGQASLGYLVTYRPAWVIDEHPVLSTQTHKQQKVRDSSLAVYL